MNETTFLEDFFIYTGRFRIFQKQDWIVYSLWIGSMIGLFTLVTGFILYGYFRGVNFPPYVWNVPIGIFIFVVAIGIDTIGHRTIYKEELAKAESLVHHITIFSGVTSVLCLILGYNYPDFFKFPALTLIGMAIFYSGIDEWMHWKRYMTQHSDRVEMWSHLFIFVGHIIMSVSWYYWLDQGYPGVKETLGLWFGG